MGFLHSKGSRNRGVLYWSKQAMNPRVVFSWNLGDAKRIKDLVMTLWDPEDHNKETDPNWGWREEKQAGEEDPPETRLLTHYMERDRLHQCKHHLSFSRPFLTRMVSLSLLTLLSNKCWAIRLRLFPHGCFTINANLATWMRRAPKRLWLLQLGVRSK